MFLLKGTSSIHHSVSEWMSMSQWAQASEQTDDKHCNDRYECEAYLPC